jgi:integrase
MTFCVRSVEPRIAIVNRPLVFIRGIIMLTNAAVKAAQAAARPYKLHDSGGLHLLVRPTGTKTFRMKYRRKGKEQLLTIGSWPEVSLGDARARRDQARDQLERNVDLKVNAAAAGISTFEQLARQWHERRRARWSPEHAADVLASLERDVFPAIGALAPRSIDAQAVLELLIDVERRGCIESARRIRERVSGVFRFGIPLQICNADPAALISDELSPRPVQRPQPALTDVNAARRLIADVDELNAPIVHKLASLILALTAVRLGTLRGGRWTEIEGIDFAGGLESGRFAKTGPFPLWRIPPARMKLTKVRKADPAAEHIVPLSRQAVAALRILYTLTGGGELMFPGRRSGRPIGEGAIGELYDRAGYAGKHVPHGWRASFSTILNGHFAERDGDDRMRTLVDQALAHTPKGRVEAAYNRARYLEQLRDVFQTWADLIEPPIG